MVRRCKGCGETYANAQGLSNHHRKCRKYRLRYNMIPHTDATAQTAGRSSTSDPVPSYHSGPRKDARRRRKTTTPAPASADEAATDDPVTDDPLTDEWTTDEAGEPMEIDFEPLDDFPPSDVEPELLERHARPNRGKLPARYVQDALPEGPAPFLEEDEVDDEHDDEPTARRVLQVGNVRIRLDTTRTESNSFGVSRRYFGRPTSVPDQFTPLEDMLNDNEAPSDPEGDADEDQGSLADRIAEAIAPYPNFSSWLFNEHHWSHDKRSKEERRVFIRNVLLHELFDTEELRGVNFDALDEQLSRWDLDDPSLFLGRGWKRSSVHFEVPHGVKQNPPPQKDTLFEAPNILHRSIPDLVCEEFSKPSGAAFHYTPFEEYYTPPGSHTPERMYGEMYSSQAFIDAHEQLQKLPAEPGCSLPRAVVGVNLMSDSAHLTDTGNAHIHPFNVAFANESMYSRGKPSNHSVHPVLHLPALSDAALSEFITALCGEKSMKNPIFTHCRREYFHAALRLLLDRDFWEMYQHGRVVECADGVKRRLYLRLFVYSADYPEKVLIATIRDGGLCPCPRCLVAKTDLDQMGTPEDMEARRTRRRVDDQTRRAKVRRARKTFHDGYVVTNSHAEKELKPESYVAIENAFSVKLDNGVFVNVFDLLVVDLMHEIELGVWIAILAHLIRILYCIGHEKVQELNRRYRDVPTFGRDVIRLFSDHVADMVRMTAHEYANMLECSPPCFEGLFGEWDEEIQSLLFTLARWHSLAKLRLHTESTLHQLRLVTIDFGNAVRRFRDGCCEAFDTYETPAEQQKRVHRAKAAAATNSSGGVLSTTDSTRQQRKFHVQTFKFHSMGDYAPTIASLGSTYNYTTAVNELSHRSPISAYQRSNKRDFESQIVKQGNIRAAHRDIQTRLDLLNLDKVSPPVAAKKRSDEHDGLVGDGSSHHHIAADEGQAVYLRDLDPRRTNDMAHDYFNPALRDYCLARLKGEKQIAMKFPDDEREEIQFIGNRIYSHARFRVNYTSYDMRRAQDCINCNTRKCNIMLLADEDEDPSASSRPAPFWYARVLGVFHARVYHPILTENGARRLDFLWVRWFGADPDFNSGWAARRLDRIGYVPSSDPDAFGFLDPKLVLRAAHIIPGYAYEVTDDLLPLSNYSDTTQGDWRYHYVNRFPDCDMMQRFTGLGIGHGPNRTRYPDDSEPAEIHDDAPGLSPSEQQQPNDEGEILDDDVQEEYPDDIQEYEEPQEEEEDIEQRLAEQWIF